MDRHHAVELRHNLFDDGGRTRRHDGDAADRVILGDISHRQAFDVVATRCEHARDARKHTGLVRHGNGERMTLFQTFLDVH